MKRRVLTVGFVVVIAVSVHAFEFVASSAVSSGGAVQLSAPGPGDLLNLPIGAPSGSWWRVETGLGRCYDLRDFDQVFAAGGYRKGALTFALGYSQFGHADLYAEKLLKGSVALQRNAWSIGVSSSLMSLGFGGGYRGLNATAFGLAGGWTHRQWQFAASVDDLNSPSFTDNDPSRPPRLSLHTEYLSGKSYSLLGRLTMQKDESARIGAGQRILLKSSSAILWGFTTAPFTFGGGIELGLKAGRLTYSANYHPVLGLTQLISVSYGVKEKRPEVPDGLR
ncbi:hypothetical protein C3F09_04845 [candidate division GN15 bacterium]|uniref:Uncharacterized protein n=1 Tax=candidate division GN15 bacterium TaxID=2072418 RepID=A0A855X289_9BACT|nr:MAG: hypothetical protein C3F09_04845 [candidate division GN15 bacterium]